MSDEWFNDRLKQIDADRVAGEKAFREEIARLQRNLDEQIRDKHRILGEYEACVQEWKRRHDEEKKLHATCDAEWERQAEDYRKEIAPVTLERDQALREVEQWKTEFNRVRGERPRLTPRAFLVGFLHKFDGTFEGCSIFSEATPTVSTRLCAFTLEVGYGTDYQSGKNDLLARLAEPRWSWIKPHLKDR